MKRLTQSKMFWAGVAMVLTSVIPAVVSGADWRSIVGAALGALVIALRPLTEKGISGL